MQLNGPEVIFYRIYAVAKKNVSIAAGFAVITISQAALGMCLVVFAARKGGKTTSRIGVQITDPLRRDCACAAQALPPIPLDAYRSCVFARHRTLEITYTSLSLLYGVWK